MKKHLALMVAVIPLVFAVATHSQEEQYAQGLIVDLYVVEAEDDATGPKGRSVATMVDPTPNTIGYLEPIDIEPALEQFRDKHWGLHSQGFLKVEEAGPHSFNLLLTSSDNMMECTTWLKIQNRNVTGHELVRYQRGNHNEYGDVTLRPGIYAILRRGLDVGKSGTHWIPSRRLRLTCADPTTPCSDPFPRTSFCMNSDPFDVTLSIRSGALTINAFPDSTVSECVTLIMHVID